MSQGGGESPEGQLRPVPTIRQTGSYWLGGRARGRLFGSAVLSFVLFQLSRFQRHHARQKVFPARAPVVPAVARPARERLAVV